MSLKRLLSDWPPLVNNWPTVLPAPETAWLVAGLVSRLVFGLCAGTGSQNPAAQLALGRAFGRPSPGPV